MLLSVNEEIDHIKDNFIMLREAIPSLQGEKTVNVNTKYMSDTLLLRFFVLCFLKYLV